MEVSYTNRTRYTVFENHGKTYEHINNHSSTIAKHIFKSTEQKLTL